MEPHEAEELKEHAEHGSHDSSMRPVAFTMSVLAVLGAVTTVLVHRAPTQTVLDADPANAASGSAVLDELLEAVVDWPRDECTHSCYAASDFGLRANGPGAHLSLRCGASFLFKPTWIQLRPSQRLGGGGSAGRFAASEGEGSPRRDFRARQKGARLRADGNDGAAFGICNRGRCAAISVLRPAAV